MAESVLAAVRTGPSHTELREFPMPDVPDDGALLKVEVAGICGTDVKMYAHPPYSDLVIMGHENVGVIERAGKDFIKRQQVQDGDRVFVEHYVPCRVCDWCMIGEFRHCENTDWRTNPDSRRYGYTSAENPFQLWGGFAHYMFLPWNAALHKVPDNVSALQAGIVTPLSNGIQWALLEAKVGYNSTVLIQGPGQQGLAQTVASKQAGASLIIVTGTTHDKKRLEIAKTLGADYVIDVQQEDPYEQIMDITKGKGLDIVLDCTAGAGTAPILLGVKVLKRREGLMVTQGEVSKFPDFPLSTVAEKAMTIKSARGHSYKAVELALEQLASERFPLDLLTTHTFGLADVDHAIRAVGGEGETDVVHVSLFPWE